MAFSQWLRTGASRYNPIKVYRNQNVGFPCAEKGMESNPFHENDAFVVKAVIPRKRTDQTTVGMAILENRLLKKVRVSVLTGRRSAPEIMKNRPRPGAVR